MPSIDLPRVEWLAKTNLQQNSHHSITISLLRGLAAVEVVAAHIRAQMFPGLKSLPDPSLWYQALSFFTGFAHQAVVVFFFLSGWLVGGSLLNKLREPQAMLSYAIDRVTRLWIVLVPVFVLTLCLAIFADTVDPRRVDFARDNAYSVTAFFGNLLGLQDIAVPRYGGNFALWSLTYESWYYVLFPLVVLCFTGGGWLGRLGAAGLVMLICWCIGKDVTLYFAVWLMGLAFSRVRIVATRAWLGLFVAVLATLSVYFRLTGSNDILLEVSWLQDVVFSIAFLLVLCSLQSQADFGRSAVRLASKAGNWLASFSFTLYVIHVPLLLAMRGLIAPYLPGGRFSPDSAGHFAGYIALLVVIVLLAWLFHLPFEAQTTRLRRALRLQLWGGRRDALGKVV
ncbi:acyltransferase family protein [Massilia glaciei]|uniref:Acyltransferase n=1 Tax=Massilia glaciei TaxID=1524097 RepID=A0A2U2I7N5_9BURK|nr:acyltransferase [Massilia glaciei]PWF55751.1 acyltransferase [Massilia glaciei]